MQRYNGQLLNQFPNTVTGISAAGAQITVRVKSTGALATLYATNSTSGATLSNPLTADGKGYYGFYAPDGVYTLDVSLSGTPQLEIQLQDVASLQTQFDDAILNAGYIPVGSFAAGCTVSQANGVVSDGVSYWRWDGALPKTVTAGSSPTPAGVSGWILVSDGGLRGDLGAADSAVLIAEVPASYVASHLSHAKAIKPVVGELNAMPRIVAALSSFDAIYIDGELPVTEVCSLTLVSKKILGTRGHSKIVATSVSSGTLFELSNNAGVEGVTFVGNLASAPDVLSASTYAANVDDVIAMKGAGALSAVRLFSTTSTVDNCEFLRFSGFAAKTGQNLNDAVDSNITNSRFYQNFGGIFQDERSEYMKFSNNSICYNVYGVYKKGGNNCYTGNNIDHNRINFVTTTALNDSHGSVVGGTMNHGKLATLVADRVVNGEVFSGVNMFDCGSLGIYLRKTIGVNIQGCLLGQTNIYCEGRSTAQAGYPGTNQITANTFNLHGGTYKIHRNWNPSTSQSDDSTPDNCIFRDNFHMEGSKARDGSSWDEQILNDSKAPDSDGWMQQGTGNSRWTSGKPLDGAMHLGNGATTGAIKVILPPSVLDYTVLTFDVSISTIDGKGGSYVFDVYAQADGSWLYYTPKTISGTFYKIRFGAEAGKWVMYFGELATVFNGGLFSINSVTAQRGNIQYSANWKLGWKISRETTAFSSVTLSSPDANIVNNDVVYQGDLSAISISSEVYAYSPASNMPAGASGGVCVTSVASANSDIRWQTFQQENSNKFFVRSTVSGAAGYTAWAEK